MSGPEFPDLNADCDRCVALCCMALAFDRGDSFAIDKAAGAACPHLDMAYRCDIHADKGRRGFSGCIAYDCLGAGQRVSQELFGGQSWRDGPAISKRMQDAFRAMREVHRLLELLQTAAALPLDPAQSDEHSRLVAALIPPEGWSEATLAQFETGDLPALVAQFLTGLSTAASGLRTV